MKEDHAEIGTVPGLRQEAAVHVGMPARLEHEQTAEVVEPLAREPSLLEHGPTRERGHTAGDDPKRLAGGVVVDCLDRA
jgi:hypothetical protein